MDQFNQAYSQSEPNAAALRRRAPSVGTTQVFDNIVSTSNCTCISVLFFILAVVSWPFVFPDSLRNALLTPDIVDRDEVDRLRKRFMKLDKVRTYSHAMSRRTIAKA